MLRAAAVCEYGAGGFDGQKNNNNLKKNKMIHYKSLLVLPASPQV